MNFSSSTQSVDVEKPRRLEEETALYLTGLEPQLEDAENNEDIGILIDNVLDEIKQRTASAASDRRTNFIIEKICNFANIAQLMEIIKRCAPYVLFLSQNRHSSHVVQNIIARLCYLLRAGETFDVDLDNLESIILTFAEPILSNFSWMAGEISGSHVLRSMVCLLTGMPLISERKSTSSKHQHSVALSEPLEKLIVPDLYYIDSKLCFQVPDAFHSALYSAVEGSLLGHTDNEGNLTHAGSGQSFSHELQLMISDTSCCAAVVILLRILFTPDLVSGGPELAEQIVMCALDWTAAVKDDGKNKIDVGADVFYAMGGDKSGSYFLEAVIECCSVSFLIDMVQRCLLSRSAETIQEFVEDNVANFIIQSVMKRITSVFNLNSRRETSIPEYDALVQLSMDILSDQHALLKPDLFAYLVQCKGGVVLWMLKLGKAMSSRQRASIRETPLCVGHTVASRLLGHWTHCSTDDVEAEDFVTALDSYMIRRFEITAPAEDTTLKGKKTTPRGPGSSSKASSAASNKPNAASLLVARQLGAILALDDSDMAAVVCRLLCRLPHETLLNISCSGPMSRSVLDIFFESKSNGRERSIFLTSFLMPNLKTICSHPIAHHTLRKCFESASSVDKERVVEAIVVPAFYETMAHTREGKAVIRFTQCDLYARNISEWKALIVRQKKAQAMLVELENVTPAPPSGNNKHSSSSEQQYSGYTNMNTNTKTNNNTNNSGDSYDYSIADVGTAATEDAAAATAGGRKRKRKRTSSKKADAAEEEKEEEDGGEVNLADGVINDEQQPLTSSDSVIDDIFEVREESIIGNKGDKKKKHKRDKESKEEGESVEDAGQHAEGDKGEKKAKKHKKSKSKKSYSGYENSSSSSSSSRKHNHTNANNTSSGKKADFQKIKLLSSAKMMSIKKLTENL